MDKFSEINRVLLDTKSLLVYFAALPLLASICILIFWIVCICFYLRYAYKHLKKLRINATDSYTQRLLRNAEINFNKFIFILVLNLVELCMCFFPLINHLIFDAIPFKDRDERVCGQDCCLKNRTFVYEIERLHGHEKYLSLFIDSTTFTLLLTIFWIFASILQYSQLAFIEKKGVKRSLISKLKRTTGVNTAISVVMWVLMAVPETILFGYPAYTVISWCYLYFIITHHLRLRELRRRHLVDLMYECYDDKVKIRREQRDLKWAQRGSKVVITFIVIVLVSNSLEMILVRTLLPILINPCWLSLQYSIHLDLHFPEVVYKYLIITERLTILLRYVILLFLYVSLVIIHLVYIVDKVMVVLRRRKVKNNSRTQNLIGGSYIAWNSKR